VWMSLCILAMLLRMTSAMIEIVCESTGQHASELTYLHVNLLCVLMMSNCFVATVQTYTVLRNGLTSQHSHYVNCRVVVVLVPCLYIMM
jgi:hypothetical protein